MGQQGDDAKAADTWLKLALIYHTNFQFEQASNANEMGFALKQKARSVSRPDPYAVPVDKSPYTFRYQAQVHFEIFDPGVVFNANESEIVGAVFAGFAEIDEELQPVAPRRAFVASP